MSNHPYEIFWVIIALCGFVVEFRRKKYLKAGGYVSLGIVFVYFVIAYPAPFSALQ